MREREVTRHAPRARPKNPDETKKEMTAAEAMETATSTSGTTKPVAKKCNKMLWGALAAILIIGGVVVSTSMWPPAATSFQI